MSPKVRHTDRIRLSGPQSDRRRRGLHRQTRPEAGFKFEGLAAAVLVANSGSPHEPEFVGVSRWVIWCGRVGIPDAGVENSPRPAEATGAVTARYGPVETDEAILHPASEPSTTMALQRTSGLRVAPRDSNTTASFGIAVGVGITRA